MGLPPYPFFVPPLDCCSSFVFGIVLVFDVFVELFVVFIRFLCFTRFLGVEEGFIGCI